MRGQLQPSLAVAIARLALFPYSQRRRDAELLVLELARAEWLVA